MQSSRLITSFVEHPAHHVGIVFCHCKNKSVKIRRNVDKADKSFNLVAFAYNPIFLVNQKRLFYKTFFLNNVVFAHKFFCNLKNRFWHGCAKKQNSAVWICLCKNRLNVIDKTHVEHFVAFVENKIIDFVEF